MESMKKKIQQRAYDFFLERGGQPGHEMEDWIRAEKEIIAKNSTIATKTSLGQPVESLVFESKKQSKPAQKQEIYPNKKAEKKLQAVNSRN